LGDIAVRIATVKTKQLTTSVDTLYSDEIAGYMPVYPNISRIPDKDISVSKEVPVDG